MHLWVMNPLRTPEESSGVSDQSCQQQFVFPEQEQENSGKLCLLFLSIHESKGELLTALYC